MTVISVRIPEEMKKEIDRLSYINWSEEIRRYLNKRIREESNSRNIDAVRLEKAVNVVNRLRKLHGAEEKWNSTRELRKWRQQRK
ncbi:MAG: hypothetical protein ACTSP4_13390 [Candidatus Hodarchaeales archaeon]